MKPTKILLKYKNMGKHIGHWKDCRGYWRLGIAQVYEHRKKMADLIGRPLKKKEVVHHWNGDISDNRIENLGLFKNQAAHKRLHLFARRHNLDMCLFHQEMQTCTF